MPGSTAQPLRKLEDLVDHVQALARKLGEVEAEVAFLEARAAQLAEQIDAMAAPVPFTAKAHVTVPQVRPLVLLSPREPSLEFAPPEDRVVPPPLRTIVARGSQAPLEPLQVISLEEQRAQLRERQRKARRRARYSWQEVASVALPLCLVLASLIGFSTWRRPSHHDDTPTFTPSLTSPTSGVSVAIPTAVLAQPTESPAALTVQPSPGFTVTPQPSAMVPSPTTPSPVPTRSSTPSSVPSPTISPGTTAPTSEPAPTSTVEKAPTPTSTETLDEATPTLSSASVEPVAPVPGGVGSTRIEVEQTFGPQESVSPDGESVYQDATVLVLYSPSDRVLRITFVLDIDELVFDREAADQLAEYYRPPGAILLTHEVVAPGEERSTYATPGLAAFVGGEDTLGRDPGQVIEDIQFDPASGSVTRIIVEMAPGPQP